MIATMSQTMDIHQAITDGIDLGIEQEAGGFKPPCHCRVGSIMRPTKSIVPTTR